MTGCLKPFTPCALGLLSLLFAGCVEGSGPPEMGEAKIVGGGWTPAPTTNDYAAASGAAGSMGVANGPSVLNDPSSGAPGVSPPGSSGTPAGASAPPPAGGSPAVGGAGGAMAATAGTGAAGTGPATGGAGGAGGAAGTTTEPVATGQPGTLTVSVTSASVGGRYAPRNVGAVWIETGSGQFVKTIERWAAIRVGDLRGWSAASGGWGFEFFGTSSAPDAVDVVTAATLTSHRAHSPSWAMKDVNGMVVPDGAYKVVLEVGDGSNATSEVMFQKGPMAQTVSAPAGGRGYSSFTVTYTP